MKLVKTGNYNMVAGMRMKHKDLYITILYFLPVENKSGFVVSTAVFELTDEIAACKQVQASHGSKFLRLLETSE